MNHLTKQLSSLSVLCSRKITSQSFINHAPTQLSNKPMNFISKGFVRHLSLNSFSLGATRWSDSLFSPNNHMFPSSKNANTTNNFAVQTRFRSNRSRRGLYDGKDIRTGHRVTFSGKKIKRKFKPNVFKKRLYSEILDTMIRFHVTTSALRSIEKYGGLDNYILKSEHIQQGEGQKIKKILLKRLRIMEFNKREFPQDVADGPKAVNDAES